MAALLLVLVLTGCGPDVEQRNADLAGITARVAATACGRPTVGSAVAIDNGLLLTNAQVLAGVESGIEVLVPGADHGLPAEVVGFDPTRDLALLAVPGFAAVPLGLATTERGERTVIAAVNNDLELVTIEAGVNRIISARSGDIYDEGEVLRRAIDLGAEVGPGASGAGVFDADLKLVGMVFADSRDLATTYALESLEIEAFLAETDPTTGVDTGRCR